ncbi:uncharacterized protein RCC_10099 [Ramularia collo-cygni]|uniref:Uncharacterized protein n=1 Tax=Ramularia collo-cygni TaxID=112498 RepID=A0A2D3VNB2_9PEZI|nr:uncharacterized protein RCC_10099 [Ramularia collo-cygni]CZT24374.1 uncharacterized protein RCC_10099 [Ramularia collo-cygni]
MALQSTQNLPEVIRNYEKVAEMVNRREMDRFIAQIRSRWDPPSHEEEDRFEGWTSEGVFTKCVYDMAFYSHDRPQPVIDPNGTDAEVNEQVQTKPSLDEIIMNYVQKPLILPPLSITERQKLLENIKTGMKQQVSASQIDPTALELPQDLDILLSMARGINGAGVPAETAYTKLIYEFGENFVPNKMPDEVRSRGESAFLRASGYNDGSGRKVPIAAFKLGGCEQHRSVYYVLMQLKGRSKIHSDAEWQIWDRIDIEVEHFDNLADWLQHETKVIEEMEGGARRELVVEVSDRYPLW